LSWLMPICSGGASVWNGNFALTSMKLPGARRRAGRHHREHPGGDERARALAFH